MSMPSILRFAAMQCLCLPGTASPTSSPAFSHLSSGFFAVLPAAQWLPRSARMATLRREIPGECYKKQESDAGRVIRSIAGLGGMKAGVKGKIGIAVKLLPRFSQASSSRLLGNSPLAAPALPVPSNGKETVSRGSDMSK